MPTALRARHAVAIRAHMQPPPELVRVSQPRIACDGASDIPGGAALGHPRVWLQIDETGYVDCGYCDRRFVLIGGPADGADQGTLKDHGDGAGR
jgi:NADH dehydrogenase (ubiquinone) Fe-S protein 6